MSTRTQSRRKIIYEAPRKSVEPIYEEIDEDLYADILILE